MSSYALGLQWLKKTHSKSTFNKRMLFLHSMIDQVDQERLVLVWNA